MEHLRPLSVTQLYPSTPADFSFVGAAASTATSAAATRQPLAEPSGNGRAQQHHSAPHIHQPRAAYRSNAAIPLYHGIHHMVHHQAHKLPLGSLATAGPLTVPSPTPTPPQSVDPWCFLSGGSSSDGRHSYKRERFAGRVRPCRRHPFYLVSEFSQYREKQKGRPETEKNWPELLEDAILDAILLVPRMGRRKFSMWGKQHGRNMLISEYLNILHWDSDVSVRFLQGHDKRRKKVSSHLQVLKKFVEKHRCFHFFFTEKTDKCEKEKCRTAEYDEEDDDDDDDDNDESFKTNRVLLSIAERSVPDVVPNYDYFEEILLADSLVQLQPKTCWIYVASRDLQINGDLGSGNITALHKPSGTILTLDMFPHLIKNVQQPAGTSAKQDGSEPPRYGGTVLGGSVAGTRAGPVDGLHPEDVILHEYTRNVQQTYSRSAKRILRDWNERFPALAAPLTQALRENPVRVVDDGTHGDYGDLCPTVADFGLGPDINCGYLLGSGGQVDVFNMHVTLDFPSPQVRFPQGAELHGLVQFTVGHQALLQHRWKCVTRLVRPVELCAPREREEHAARMRRRRGHGEVTRRQQHGAARRHGRRHQRSRNHDLGSDHESDGGVVDHRMMNINTSEDLDLDTENDDGYDKDDRLDTTVRNSIITEHSSEICIQYRHKHDCAYMRSHQQQSGTSGLTMLVKGSCDCIATPLPDIRVPFPANEWVTMLSNLTYLVDLEQPGGSAGDGMEPSEPKPGSTSQQQSQTPVRRSARRSTAASTTTRNNSSAVTPPTKKAANANSTEPRASDLMGRIAMYQELWSLAPGSSSADAEDDVAGQQQSLLSPGSMSVPGGWTRRAAIAWTFAPNYKWMHDAKTNKPEFQASVPDTKWRHMTALDPSDRAHQQRMYAPRKGAGGGVPSDVGVAGHGGFESPTLGTPTLDGGSSMAHQGLIALDSHNYAHRHHVLSALSPAASSISAGDGGKFEPFLTGGAADSGSVDSPSLASSPWDSMAPGFGLLAAATTASMRQPVKGPNSHFSSVHQHHHHQAHHPHMFCHHATLGISGPRSSSAGRGHGQSAFAHGLATPPLGTPLPADFLGAVDGVPHQPHQHQHPTAGASTSNPTSSVDPALEHWSAMVGLTQAAANGEDSSGLATWASAGPGAGSVTSARAVTAAALTCTPTVDAVTKTATDLAAATAAKATRGTKRAYDDGGCGAISGYGDEDEDWGCRYRDQQRQDRHHDEQQFLRLQTDGPWVEGM